MSWLMMYGMPDNQCDICKKYFNWKSDDCTNYHIIGIVICKKCEKEGFLTWCDCCNIPFLNRNKDKELCHICEIPGHYCEPDLGGW